ncbi:MAG: SMC family ATPase, partial [Candidatus Micrarchaeota archaeon]
RQVNLADVIMSRPGKKASSLVEVTFTANEKNYSVTRSFSTKGAEAFLRCDGALLEGPQPVRTTEAVSRILKVDYETFARVIYGEQNKLDYFLTLPKGSRKAQLDDVIGISLFEKVRVNSNSLVSKLKSEKINFESFLSGVDVEAIEKELTSLKNTLQVVTQRKTSLESNTFALANELETIKKNLESLEELKKLNEDLSLQLVKAQTEANSLQSSAVSVMPLEFSKLTREQCTAVLEECSRSIQERLDFERQATKLINVIQRLQGEGLIVKQIIEQFPVEQLKNEIELVSQEAKQLEIVSAEFLEIAKRESFLKTNAASLQKELNTVALQMEDFAKKTSVIVGFERDFSNVPQLEQLVKSKQQELLSIERLKATKFEVISSLEKSLSLLQKENAACPTCDQAIPFESLQNILKQKQLLLEKEKSELVEITKKLTTFSNELTNLSTSLSKWVELLPAVSKLKNLNERKSDLQKTLSQTSEEFVGVSQLVKTSEEKVRVLKTKTQHLDGLKQNLIQAEKASEKLVSVESELKLLNEQLAKKNLALSTFEAKDKLETKLNDARSALKAFELFEKTEALKVKARELSEKLSSLQFDNLILINLREKFSTFSSNLQSSRVSLEHTTIELKEKTDLVAKLESQFVKLSTVKKNCSDLDCKIRELTIFQNSLVETQAELRAELIGAVNEAMHEVWKNIYPYRDYSSCRIVASEDDYAMEVLSSDGWKPVEQCSGGEKTCVALSLRVSLAMVLVPNLSWLVLDEPTHNLDANGVNLLARALHETLPSIVKQTFVVTHDEALKEGASGSVHVFQRNKDEASATTIETLS